MSFSRFNGVGKVVLNPHLMDKEIEAQREGSSSLFQVSAHKYRAEVNVGCQGLGFNGNNN